MSFAPPSPGAPDHPKSPLGPPTGGRPGPPRSTPIPGFESPSPTPGTAVPGNWGAAPPPRPTDFVNGVSTSPLGAPEAPPPITKQGRSWAATIFVVLLFAGPIAGLGIGAWAFLKGRDTADKADQAIEDANQTVDSLVQGVQEQIDDITEPGIVPSSIPVILPTGTVTPVTAPAETAPPVTAPPVVSLFAEGGAPMVIGTFEGAISGEPSRFMQVILYPDYAFATAQDANIPTHVDEYPWRDGVVGASRPVQLMGDGDLEANLWRAPEVDWSFIARAVAEAPGLTTVEEGTVSHIIVERSVFTTDFAIVVRVYVTGPRGGGYVEYTPAGVLIQVVQ